MSKLHLSIVTPQGKIFDGDVNSVTLPGAEGEFGVLPNHADTVSLLGVGAIDIQLDDGNRELVAINWGYCRVDEKGVDVLAEGAVAIAGSSESQIAQSISDAKELLESASDNNVMLSSVVSKIETAGKSYL